MGGKLTLWDKCVAPGQELNLSGIYVGNILGIIIVIVELVEWICPHIYILILMYYCRCCFVVLSCVFLWVIEEERRK